MNLNPFTISVSGKATCWENETGERFTDFMFTADPAQRSDIMGTGSTFFGNCPAGTTTELVCTVGATGSGIANDTIFTISFSHFTKPTTLTATPSVPEPSAILLLGTGVLGLAGFAGRRFRGKAS